MTDDVALAYWFWIVISVSARGCRWVCFVAERSFSTVKLEFARDQDQVFRPNSISGTLCTHLGSTFDSNFDRFCIMIDGLVLVAFEYLCMAALPLFPVDS